MRILSSSAVYIVAGLALGLTTAIYGLDHFGLKSVTGQTGWQEWSLNQSDRFEPYSVGHFLSGGRVPTPNSAKFFVRDVDDDGNILSGNCIFSVEGSVVRSRWWSISVDSGGTPSAAATLSAGKAVLESNGQLSATISREPMPGNWIQPDANGAFQIIYAVSEPSLDAKFDLPRIKKRGC
jgi:hypothetical protein